MVGYWPRSINTQEKELGQHPVILTSRSVNNSYLWPAKHCTRGIYRIYFSAYEHASRQVGAINYWAHRRKDLSKSEIFRN